MTFLQFLLYYVGSNLLINSLLFVASLVYNKYRFNQIKTNLNKENIRVITLDELEELQNSTKKSWN